MQSNIFGNVILGTSLIGQGSINAVEGTHRTTLRKLVALYVGGLALRLGDWRALVLKRATAAMVPAVAVCASHSPSRRQRHERWMSAVAVDSGPVGVC